ncbi:hypothetical protein tb265_24940 [Gemmatimonadetes bacterium T265]|nr:hypothetical protein tb265_24940 [Gemmatimonadetes bacterium T265]
MRRVLQLVIGAACFLVPWVAHPAWASPPEFRLRVVPAVVYNVDDPGNARTSSFVFDVVVICSADCALTPVAARVDLSHGRSAVERPGNCVIIDHGNAEYSVLAHMQNGSVQVKAGDRVAAGQVIGRLGNSGDPCGPHVHYQLQSGPQLFRDQSLPFRFQNIDPPKLSRGTYFDAK